MKITLELVRQILRELLGFESFTARFITKTIEDKDNPSASITREGTLSYNPEFVKEYVQSKEDLFSLVFHEILHPLFCHFIYGMGKLENIAADAVINAVISLIYENESDKGNLFRRVYSPEGLAGILRAGSNLQDSPYEGIYDALYSERGGPGMTTGELIQTLKILSSKENLKAIVLLGSHDKEKAGRMPKDILEKIALEIKKHLPKNDHYPGYGENLLEMFLEIVRVNLSFKEVLLQRFFTKRKIDRFKETFETRRRITSPFPVYPSKRDLTLLASGIYPGYFHNQIGKQNFKEKGLAVYLDVSGSVTDYLPQIIGILKGFEKRLESIFLFSNKVAEISFSLLLKGKIETTYGTDFDCVASSICERNFDKAVVITDGYASLAKEWKEKLRKQKVHILTILFDGKENCDDLASFGEVVLLEEATR